jgi:hypothetical protein
VGGFSTGTGVVTFGDAIDANGKTVTFTGGTLKGGFTADGTVTLAAVHATGVVTFADAIDANGKTLTFTGGTIVGGFSTGTGVVTFGDAIDANGKTVTFTGGTLKGGFTADGTVTLAAVHSTGVVTFANAIDANGKTLTFTGGTIKGGFTADGTVTLAAVHSTGVVTFANAIDANGKTLTFTGGTIKGGYTADGVVTLAGVHTTGTVTFGGSLELGGATVAGGLSSTGIITVTNAGGLNVDAVVTVTGLESTGTVTASGAALTSDRRYKNHIQPLQLSPLDSIMKLQGVQYSWKRDEFPEHNFDNFTHYGFIAQDVEEVIPGIVGTDDEGWKALRYMGFTPILVEALKEQQTEIEELKSRVDLLTKFICSNGMLSTSATAGGLCGDVPF